MKVKILLAALSLMLLIGLGSCSTDDDFEVFGNIYGMVVDAANGEPIAGATITLSPGGRTQTSGSDGVYEFKDVDPMQYTVIAQKPGYQSNYKKIKVDAGDPTQANVTLTKID